MSETATRKPRFNHVAMSVPADLLDEAGRKQLCDFYGEVFGWVELPTETVDRKKLVFGVHAIEQFVFLIADDSPMTAPRLDHFGLSVGTEAELDDVLAKAKAYRGATTGSTSSTRRPKTTACSRSRRSTWGICSR